MSSTCPVLIGNSDRGLYNVPTTLGVAGFRSGAGLRYCYSEPFEPDPASTGVGIGATPPDPTRYPNRL